VTGIWELPFIGSIVLLLFGAMLAFKMRPDEELDEHSPLSELSRQAG
jgi:hypothetical protein